MFLLPISRDTIAPMDRPRDRERLEASGASKARQKLAAYLRERGVRIAESYYPPEDKDFWNAIKQFAEQYGAVLPPMDPVVLWKERLEDQLKEVGISKQFRESPDEAGKPEQPRSFKHLLELEQERKKRKRRH
jgi:hypothetical protein